MEQVPNSSGECRRAKRCSLDQLSKTHAGAQTNQTQPFFYNTSSAHTVTQNKTSSMTRVSSCCETKKTSNRGESTHFCCCLHRRRTLLKRWSRKHREAARPSTEKGDSSSKQNLHDSHHIPQTETCESLLSQHNNPLFMDNTFNGIDRAIYSFKDNRATFVRSHVNERQQCEMQCVSSTGVVDINKLSRSKISSSHAVCIDSGRCGAEIATPSQLDASGKPEDLRFHARLRPSIPQHAQRTGETPGRLLLDYAAGAFRIVPSTIQILRRLAGGSREVGRRPCESRTITSMNSTVQMTFHRWLVVLLVCIMVLPVHSTAAPGGLPGLGSVVEEPGNEPGYKNSYYQELPPKAEYESVIICLLAVSAFIGLIVWVLKSNFEERQQKRMRREASIRERTSSVACLKT